MNKKTALTLLLSTSLVSSIYSVAYADDMFPDYEITAALPVDPSKNINNPQNLNPNTFLDREGTWNSSIAQMRGQYSLAKGYDGRVYLRNADGSLQDNIADGYITVGVVDTGVFAGNTELDANVLKSKSVTCTTTKGCVANGGIDTGWHGTAVAGIIAGERNGVGMNGIAPNAKILPIAAIGVSGGSISDSIDYATKNKVQIINGSYGLVSGSNEIPIVTAKTGSAAAALTAASVKSYLDTKGYSVTMRQAVQNAVDNHEILVYAAGNGSMDQVGLLAGLPYYFRGTLAANVKPVGYDTVNPTGKDWSKNFIAAVSVDANNQISSFSNRCGVAKDWCLAAPGSNLITTYTTNGYYVQASGTSFAAPNASGALAALMGAFPHLSPETVTQILFKTATDLGAVGVDDIYGNGLINMEKAINPSDGGWKIALGTKISSNTTPVTVSSIVLPAAFGAAVKSSNSNIMFLDEYNKDYAMPLSSLAASQTNKIDLFTRLNKFGSSPFEYNVNDGRTKIGASFAADQYDKDETNVQKSYFSTSIPSGNGNYDAAFAYNANLSEVVGFSGLQGVELAPKEVSTAFKNPYLGLAQSASASVLGYHTDTGGLRVGFYDGDLHENASDYSTKSGVRGAFAEMSFADDDKKSVSFTVGMNNEENSVLGGESSGALALGNSSSTYYGAVAGKYKIDEHLSLMANYNVGVTKVQDSSSSLFSDTSKIVSDSFSVGMEYKNLAQDNDKLQVSLSQPLRVMSGSSNLTLPQDVTPDGDIIYSKQKLGLAAQGRELDLESFYNAQLDESSDLKLGATVRFSPDNNSAAPSEGVLLAKYKLNF
jgi:hypothetical protein